jgi:2'-5' RNA ligase
MPVLQVDRTPDELEAAWALFQAAGSLLLVGDTLEWQWTRGRAQYLAFLVRLEDAAARDYVSRVQERIAVIPGVELYPDWYWHITVKGAGFQVIKRTHDDDVLRQDVPRIAAQARELLARQPAFEAQLGLANGFSEVVFIELHDGGRVRELNTLLTENLPVPRYPIDGGTFLPHVSIARFTSNEGLARLKETLAALRREGPGPAFSVRRIEFVKVWLSEAMPEFDTLATYPLAARSGL